MNPPVVLSVRIKGDAEGPQTGDVILDNSPVQNWAPGKEYEEGDVFVYDAQFYQATEDFIAGETFNTDHCVQIGIPDLILDGFTPNTYYEQGEMITQDGQLFIATEDFTSEEAFNKNDWTQIGGGSYNFVSSDGTVQISIQDGGETVSFSVANTMNSAVRELQDQIDEKQDKVEGKGLSTNDYTDGDKQKLAALVNFKEVGDNLQLTQNGRLNVITTEPTYDNFMSLESENAVQNKTITAKFNDVETEIQEAGTDIGHLEDDIELINTSLDNLRTRTSAAEGEIDTLQADVLALDARKVDKVAGKSLSSNDYTTEDKTKLTNLENIKSIGSGLSLDANGELSADGGTQVLLYKETGQHTDGAMTQKATTDALSLKADRSSLAAVATSGSYEDLSNKPTIPTQTSQLINDSNFVADANYVHTDYNFTQGYIDIINDYNNKELTAVYDSSTKTVTLNWTPKN